MCVSSRWGNIKENLQELAAILFVHFEHQAIIFQLGNSDFLIQQVQITKST